eukprot:CAMPEP_0203912610 /NCGR_PEP_ID=MMETSP0359-20131031/53667_1 /ASSEMBLY_ACC=CAM_ASM_000338 /TAXON_ID=268821 /ORGANISM="Scrippsiella Hangoei, Strain SHTV-5" /LENGTH=86 /DNA_ID=CAMNT_0050838581 /DNA_START=514 /DNA_END=775 /DNA_ORIENTATION=+
MPKAKNTSLTDDGLEGVLHQHLHEREHKLVQTAEHVHQRIDSLAVDGIHASALDSQKLLHDEAEACDRGGVGHEEDHHNGPQQSLD